MVLIILLTVRLRNSVDQSQIMHSAASDQGLRNLPGVSRSISGSKLFIVFDVITAHAPVSTQSSNSVVHCIQITAIVNFVYYFIKAFVVRTHLNCIDLSMRLK